MFVRSVRFGLIIAGATMGAQAIASTPHAALPTKPIAAFVQVSSAKKPAAKILYYKNEDLIKTTSTTVKTPIYTTVVTPVYSTVKTPILDSKGKITGYKTTQVQTGTTSSQKITGYNSVTTKATAITAKDELYTTNGSSTTASPVAVKFLLDAIGTPFQTQLASTQDAMFSFAALTTKTPTLQNGLFTQVFDTGSMSFKRTTPLFRMDALGHATGPALDNLLTITFQNAVLTATKNGATIGFAGNTPGSTINFTSDFRQFTKADWLTNFDFAIAGNGASANMALATVDPTLTNVTGARTLNSFRVSTTGTFAASDVPEPASWAMMLIGFAAIGVARRSDVRKLARVIA